MRTLTEDSSDLLRQAVKDGVVSTVLAPFDGQTIPPDMFRWVLSNKGTQVSDPNTFELAAHPKSQRYFESAFPPRQHLLSTQYWAVELARIAVPNGQIGVLTSIEQVLMDRGGSYYPTSIDYWGSPVSPLPDVNNCRWYLTLDYFDGLLPPRFNLLQAQPILPETLPGYPYPEIFEIDGLWYPAHCSASGRLKCLIPGSRVLRFYFLTPPTEIYTWRVRGRLRAYLQSTYSSEAASNARLF